MSAIAEDERAALAGHLPAYEIHDVLGRGAFAVVYAAEHRTLRRAVAIKRLSPELLPDRDARERFGAEARLLASLDHPHVVRVHDYVESEDVCALVLERMYGGTLADRMRVGALPPPVSCAVTIAVLNGLEHAHQHGVLHRDIKPANLLFGERDLVKVADFGIAKVIGAQGARLTATAGTLGTPAYMAPEQVHREAGPLSPATDVWATAAVLYELLSGQTPFRHHPDATLAELLVRRISEDPRPITEVTAALPVELCDVVMRGLARDPSQRFATAGAFASALEVAVERGFGAGTLRSTRVPIHRTEPTHGAARTVIETDEPALIDTVADAPHQPWRPTRRVVAGTAALIVAGVIALIVVLASGGGGSSAPGNALAVIPGPPPGWPHHVAIGYTDQVRTASKMALRTGPGGIDYYPAYGGDAASMLDWSHQQGIESPQAWATAGVKAGLLPYTDYYEIRQLGRRTNNNDGGITWVLRAFASRRLMKIYWENVTKLLKQLGKAHGTVALSIEPSVWGLVEQHLVFNPGLTPSAVPVIVKSTGIPAFRNETDDLTGYWDAWRILRNEYAPNVLLGVCFDFWGTNYDIGLSLFPKRTLLAAATEQGRFFLDMSNNNYPDFVSFEDSGTEQGADPHAPYPTDAYKQQVLVWIRQFVQVTHRAVVLESIPAGNTVMKTIDDKPWHWHDHWVQWLMGDPNFTHLRELWRAGLIGVQFGGFWGSQETCPCDAAHDGITNRGKTGIVSTSPDDDGGYLYSRMQWVIHHGGLPLA